VFKLGGRETAVDEPAAERAPVPRADHPLEELVEED
jgi:hypothetical protein